MQLTWPLPPEVLAQMDPTTRLTMLRAMQSSGVKGFNVALHEAAFVDQLGTRAADVHLACFILEYWFLMCVGIHD